MKRINFSNTGRLGFTQGDLDFMQQAYGDIATAFTKMGGGGSYFNPIIISGMEQSGTYMSPGWFAVAGVLYYCAGGDTGMYPALGNSFVVSLSPTSVQRPYRNGNLLDVRTTTVGTFHIMANADIDPDIDFLVSTFVLYGAAMGERHRLITDEITLVSVSVGDVEGSIVYTKDVLANTLSLRVALNVNDAQALDPALTASFYDMTTLPAGCRPTWPQIFSVHRNSAGMMRDFDGYGLLKQFTAKVDSYGVIAIEFIKPASGIAAYSVYGTAVISLD
ncbi:hypothetical protein CJD36_019800 [Flavipsychrobacter stenotrophus]|uniref:Uncharacterized protein n=1 Tax=Flavipsychrobacter stenotrophus TaxID=2077091 RepID=A0A2S7SSG6_9BACT|nr:hypothetical protein [Flavipsychrobacter stenotrophus]PQJ09486.1 hypothetical protein CJD36_019800 [Flavipsychrobacter stenotrophus]